VATIIDQQTTDNQGTQPLETRPTTVEDPNAASLDKVRDILFGGQMRDVDQRFARLEERLVRETAELSADIHKQLAAVEQFASAEAHALAERIKAEYDARTTATRDLSRQLHDTAGEFERRAGLIDDQLARAQRELRQQILDVQQQLTNEIRQKFDAVLGQLRQEAVDLRTAKADRGTLAALFTEIAMKLASDSSIGSPQEPAR
jgi:DNA anti-recombination protein RmuC